MIAFLRKITLLMILLLFVSLSGCETLGKNQNIINSTFSDRY